MKLSHIVIAGLALGSVVPFVSRSPRAPDAAPRAEIVEVTRGPITVTVDYEGMLESRRALPVSSPLSQSAVIIELAPEGHAVAPGDVVARFDASGMERERIDLERDVAVARAQRDALRDGTHPMKLEELTARAGELDETFAQAREYLADTRELLADALVSPQEVTRHEREVEQARRQCDAFARQIALTREQLHPAELARADATLASAELALRYMEQQMASCTITAEAPGFIVYAPLHLNGEYRTVRAGDTVYRNQPFLYVADMTDLVVRCYIPENELALVDVGDAATVTPLAYPELPLPAAVAAIGSMAQTIPGRPVWQKYFQLTLRLETTDPRLRSGMTARARIRAYSREQAVCIPRRAVTWQGDTPTCTVETGDGPRVVTLTLGPGNERDIEVIAGLDAGARVRLP